MFAMLRIHSSISSSSHATDLVLGTANTAVLLTSSLTMALAAASAKTGRKSAAFRFLVGTALLGLAFLAIKSIEYYVDYAHHLVPGVDFVFAMPHAVGAAAFFWLYFAMSGIHAVHLLIGIVVVLVLACRLWQATRTDPSLSLQVTGLYWHFVDVVWIFLFGILYLGVTAFR